MGQTKLDKEQIKKIIAEELNEIIEGYDVSIEDIDIDIKWAKVQVTFGLHTVDDDNYIGLCFY